MPKNTSAPLTASASVPVMCSRLVTLAISCLCRIQALVALADDAEALTPSMMFLYAEEHQELGDGDRSRAAAVDNHLDLVHLAAGQAAGVEQSRTAADSRAVLVIVEYRNVADLFQTALDLKAARSGDVLEVDAAERAGDQLNGADDLVHILGRHTERERIHVSERLEQRALALHNRHAGNRTDIAQTEHRSAVRDDRNQIVAARVLVAERRIVLDLKARLGNTRRVRDRQIVLAVLPHSELRPQSCRPIFRVPAVRVP